MLLGTNYAQNYAGIIGASLLPTTPSKHPYLLTVYPQELKVS